MSIKRLLVIVGPTGSGKTDLSIRIARRYGAPILSTDSRQFYRGMPVGTAQPTAEQLQAAEHHFIADREIDRHLNCGAYEAEALARLEALFATHDIVVAVGGSGLYVRALCEGMDDLPPADEALRERLNTRLREEGIESLANELKRLPPIGNRWTAATRRVFSGPWRSACKRDDPTRRSARDGSAHDRLPSRRSASTCPAPNSTHASTGGWS